MEQSKIALKSKANKIHLVKKEEIADSENTCSPDTVLANNLNLTLDNSLRKYASDPFFVNHAKETDQKFAQSKSNT